MKTTVNSRMLSIAFSTVAANLGMVSLAQGADGGLQLEEVVVTAQKRVQSMQDVPVSVSAFSGEDLESRGFLRPADVAAQVPNMQVSSPFGDVQPLFAIRGVSMISYNPSQASPIGIYADETYIGATYLHGLSMFDMERLEVLRGPQGTLFGKNTTGGAINMASRTPAIDDSMSGYIKLGAGDYGSQTADGAIEGTLIDGVLAARLAATYKEDDGVWENDIGPDMSQTKLNAVRLSLNFQPSEQLNALLKVTSGESDPRHAPPRAEGTAAGGVNYAGNTEVINPGFLEGSVNETGKTKVDLTLVNLKLSYELDDYSLISVTSYYDGDYQQKQDLDGTSQPFFGMDWGSDTNAVSQDIRVVSEYDGPFNFIVGAYYGDEETNTDILHEDFFGVPTPAATNPQISAIADGVWGSVRRRVDLVKESLAVYSHMTYDFTEKLGVTVGLRYTDDDTRLDHYNISRLDGEPLVLPPPFPPITTDTRTEGTWIGGLGNQSGIDSPLNPATLMWTHEALTNESAPKRSETEQEFTGTVSLDYRFSDDVLSYVKYSRGYRSGSYGEDLVYLDAGDDLYADPEFIDAYELGVKSELFDSRLRLNAALFYYDYTDQQFTNNVGLSGYLVNAGKTDIYGMELELLAALTEGWTVQAGLGLLDSEYKELTLSDLSTEDPSDTMDLSGNTPVSSPDVNFNIASDYETDIFNSYMLRLHVDGAYIDDQWFSAYNDQIGFEDISQDAYWVFNARAAFSDAAEKYTMSFWVKNMADEEYDVYGINLQTAAGYNYFSQGAPRTYGVDFTFNF
jgi:iron complex outermembrane receptor protein